MSVVYVTYIKDGVKRKGSLKEEKYQALLSDPTVTDLETYPSPKLMEQSFKGNSNKRMLLS